jgi:alpha-L-arabinofuranosidase
MTRITVDATPRHAISPLFYMQFMEPLGTTDSSVAACWDVLKDRWREDFIEVVRDLAPSSIRWGGILTSFWKWRESVGAPSSRRPMVNYLWGGVETNRVGVDEFLQFCEAVRAEPLMAINFAADGRPEYIDTALGEHRAGTPEEAADLVSYCNDPDNAERRANGRAAPWAIRNWQIGNETSYPAGGHRFTAEENAEHYVAFARAMRARDPSIRLVGWGDREHRNDDKWWAEELLKRSEGLIDMVALHMMQQRPVAADTVLRGRRYRQDYDRTWAELGDIYRGVEEKLARARDIVSSRAPGVKLAITEGHLSIEPHNKNELLREWISAVYHARVLTLFENNSDIIDICTLADFAGQSWLVNAVLLGSPREKPYLLPVGHVMKLFRKHSGDRGLKVASDSGSVVASGSRRGNTVYLHVTNLDLHSPAEISLDFGASKAASIRAHRFDPASLDAAIDSTNLDAFPVVEVNGTDALKLPPASVSALQIELA